MSQSASSTATKFYIPDTLAAWPWPRDINPFYERCKAESSSWCQRYGAFSPRGQKAFDLCDFNLLASLAYARLPADVNRVGCDLMNFFFVIDEHTDAMDPQSVQNWVDIIIDALHNPHVPRPQDEPVVGEVARTFWENAIRCLGPTSRGRFIETFTTYLEGVVTQAFDRDNNHFRDVDSYMKVRRRTIGAEPSFALLEHDMELPDYVFNHHLLESLREWAIDMLILGNDLCSYNVEQSRGDDGHNIVALVILQENTDIHGALDFISNMHDKLAEKFLLTYKSVPTFGDPIDAWVTRYIDGLGNWVRANDSWSFESWRYFKIDGLRIQKERWVDLLPQASKDDLTSSIPPESRWIKAAVVPSRGRPKNIGIVAMDVIDTTSTRDGEVDIQTLALKAIRSLMSKYDIKPASIGRLDICCEQFTDPSVIPSLRKVFAPSGNTDVEAILSFDSVASLFNAVNWVESSSWDGRYAIVLGGGFTSGISVALIGPDAPIVVEPTRGTYFTAPCPSTGSTNDFFLKSLFQAYTHYNKKLPKSPNVPNLSTNGRPINGFDQRIYDDTSSPAIDYVILHNRQGQIASGTGAFYLQLASMVSEIDPKELQGKRIGAFGLTNSAGAFFAIRIVGDCSLIRKYLGEETKTM